MEDDDDIQPSIDSPEVLQGEDGWSQPVPNGFETVVTVTLPVVVAAPQEVTHRHRVAESPPAPVPTRQSTRVRRFGSFNGDDGFTPYIIDSNSDSDSSDPDFILPVTPGPGQRQRRPRFPAVNLLDDSDSDVDRNRTIPLLVDIDSNSDEPTPGPSTASPRRKFKKKKRRSKAVRKIKKPEKPPVQRQLAPKTVVRPIKDNTDAESHFESLIYNCSHHFNVYFNQKEAHEISDNATSASCDSGFIVGSVELQFNQFSSLTIDTINSIPGIHQIVLHVNEEANQSVLVVKTRTQLGDDECKVVKLSSGLKESELRRKYYYVDEKCQYYKVGFCGGQPEIFGGLANKKVFRLELPSFSQISKEFMINFILLNSAVIPQHDINACPIRNLGLVADVVKYFFGIDKITNYDTDQSLMKGKEDIEWFYGQIKKYHRRELLPDMAVQHSSKLPVLRDYQKDAVKWMLYRENDLLISDQSDSSIMKTNLIEILLDKMFILIELVVNNCNSGSITEETKCVYYNPYFGVFAWNRPILPRIISGGILCDEMGLGKTVEVLALVLLNQCPDLKALKEEEFDTAPEQEEEAYTSKTATIGKKRKVGKSKSRKAKKSKVTRTKSTKAYVKNPSIQAELQTPDLPVSVSLSSKKRRRREASPCEFETIIFDSPETVSTTTEVFNHETKTEISELEQAPSSSAPPKKKAKKPAAEVEQNESTYSRIKVMYDATLSQYSESAKITKKFYGEFFNPNIKPKACFECICGEAKEDNSKYIVTCGLCLSSQHAECVGFKQSYENSTVPYLCPHCISTEIPIDVKTTIIITPTTISHQWIQEIQKHVKNTFLKILYYKGVSAQGYIPPSKLAQYDIIITTYTILADELNYVDLPHCSSADGRQFRNPKRYLTIPSPLLSVKWWRICLDEAQMVEGSTTKMALMALRLKSIHRWCITGTPMNKGLEDLYGLFAFLELQPVNVEFWWNSLISKSFYEKDSSEVLFELFGQLVWRTCKSDVLDQLGIPAQSEVVHWSKFSPLETHFYKRQFEVCSQRILEKVSDTRLHAGDDQENFMNRKLTQLDRDTLKGLLHPFLVLRQACVHPQMVKGNWISLNKLKGTLTMEDLLDQLIKKSTLQCTDDNRLIVSSLNAIAGLYLIQYNYVEAAKSYREVLQQENKHKDKFITDSLQMVHTLENLADVLDGNYSGVGYTLRDDTLRSEANEIKKKYLETYASGVEAARNVINPVTASIIYLELKLEERIESWWVSSLTRAARIGKDDDLVHRLKDDLSEKSTKRKTSVHSIAARFTDLSGLEALLIGKLLELIELRDSVVRSLDELGKRDPKSLVESAVACHLRKQQGHEAYYYNENVTGYRCILCGYHDKFLKFESVLFSEEKLEKITRTGRNWQKVKIGGRSLNQLTQDELDRVLIQEQEELFESTEHANLKGVMRRGNWGPSETERVLKIILGFAKLNGCSQQIVEDGTNHIKLLDATKKEFKLNRILWRNIYDQVSALDELMQATTRLRLATPAEIRQQEQEGENAPTSSARHRRKATAPTQVQQNQFVNIYNNPDDEKLQNLHILKPHEVELKMHQSQLDLATGKQNLTVHMGQIIYLETLKKNDYGKKGSANSDDCLICCHQLGHEWCVLVCGHSFCSDCVRKMCPNQQHSFQCPLCRISMKYRDISFVDTKLDDDKFEDPEPEQPQPSTSKGLTSTAAISRGWSTVLLTKEIKGSHSSKVGLIVETLLKLQISHRGEKVIIFSSWAEVLEIIGRALEQNDIQYCLLTSGKKFQTSLNRFKTREDIQVLLMPMASGSKGLNIIEATHVFLVEPTLNLANELQAIGRVHRIGQMKPTIVHRFYVRQTIEEQLYEILKTHDISSDEEGSLTVADLKNLVTKQ